VATSTEVLALPGSGSELSSPSGALVIVAANPGTAARLAQAAANSRISLALTADPR